MKRKMCMKNVKSQIAKRFLTIIFAIFMQSSAINAAALAAPQDDLNREGINLSNFCRLVNQANAAGIQDHDIEKFGITLSIMSSRVASMIFSLNKNQNAEEGPGGFPDTLTALSNAIKMLYEFATIRDDAAFRNLKGAFNIVLNSNILNPNGNQ